MAARQRDSVRRTPSSSSQMTYAEFIVRFPDNATCLDYLRDKFYEPGTKCPGCGKPSKFHRIKGRSAYSCQYCRHQVYPTAGTIFHKSTVSLQLWFWAIFLVSSTRCGISAKQLEREIGVSNKTALRMFHQIRKLLAEDDSLGGNGEPVELDETFYGGRPHAYAHVAKNSHWDRKQIVMAAVERNGRIRTKCVPTSRGPIVDETIREFILPGSMVYTDEYRGYNSLGKKGYYHRRVNHGAKIYVEGVVHTNTIEGFFGLVKNGIRGVYHSVSRKHLQGYLDEYTFRYNRRDGNEPIFWAILNRVQKAQPAA